MKIIFELLKKILLFIIEIPSRIEKGNYIYTAELKLDQLEYKYLLDNSEKTAEDIRDAKIFIRAMKKCPAFILVDEIKSLNVIDKEDITEEMCERFIKRIELYSS